MQIHSQDEPPFIDQLGFGVAPGFQTFVACQEQRVRGPQEAGPGEGARGRGGVSRWSGGQLVTEGQVSLGPGQPAD